MNKKLITLNDVITDEQIIKIARNFLRKCTFPCVPNGYGKSALVTRIISAMLYLIGHENE